MIISQNLDGAFEAYTDTVVTIADNVNKACRAMKAALTAGQIDTHGTTFTGNARVIRDYENALEELKGFIQNRSPSQLHNQNLKLKVNGVMHALRCLEVELVHGDSNDELMITAVKVRGLISLDEADGNEAPTYSSKSSSSSVPPPPP